MIVVYHSNCVDGFTAAWCAWRKFGDSAKYIPAQYGDAPPDCAGEDVAIVDFSYPRAVLLEMHRIAKSLLVLDHHKTAQAELDGLPFCKFDMSRSGAKMAEDEWHLDQHTSLVAYVQDRDLWKFELPGSREVNAYVGIMPRTFADWTGLANQIEIGQPMIAMMGRAVLQATEAYVGLLASETRPITIGGHVVPSLNTTHAHSELIGAIAERNPDAPFAAGWFQKKDGAFVYSLRSRGDFDVSAIAKQYGGGGHAGAAGFTVSELLK